MHHLATALCTGIFHDRHQRRGQADAAPRPPIAGSGLLPCIWSLWVISCRGVSQPRRPFYPQKLPRRPPTGASAKGQKRTHAPQHNAGRLMRDGPRVS
jgi:hypothetical protein